MLAKDAPWLIQGSLIVGPTLAIDTVHWASCGDPMCNYGRDYTTTDTVHALSAALRAGVHSVLIERDIGRNFPPSQLSQLRLTVGLRLLGPIGIFAGPVWNVAEDFSATSGDYRTIFGHGAAGARTWFESADHAMRVRAWPGVVAGITLFGY